MTLDEFAKEYELTTIDPIKIDVEGGRIRRSAWRARDPP
jgi:hypothetical protein